MAVFFAVLSQTLHQVQSVCCYDQFGLQRVLFRLQNCRFDMFCRCLQTDVRCVCEFIHRCLCRIKIRFSCFGLFVNNAARYLKQEIKIKKENKENKQQGEENM